MNGLALDDAVMTVATAVAGPAPEPLSWSGDEHLAALVYRGDRSRLATVDDLRAERQVAGGLAQLVGASQSELTEAGWVAPTSPLEVACDLVDRIVERGVSGPLGLALPDRWFDSELAACEALTAAMADAVDGHDVSVYPRSQCAAAGLALDGGTVAGRHLVTVDVLRQGTTLVLHRLEVGASTSIEELASANASTPVEPPSTTADPVPKLSSALAWRAAVRSGERRAGPVIRRALHHGHYRDAVAYDLDGADGDRPITASEVLRVFREAATRVATAIASLLDEAHLTDTDIPVCLIDGPLPPALLDESLSHLHLPTGGVTCVSPTMVATGAAQLARGDAVGVDRSPATLAVSAHRRRHGVLVPEWIEIGRRSSTPARGTEPPVVEVCDGRASLSIRVDDPAGTGQLAPQPIELPSGRYELAFWPRPPDRIVLSCRPTDGGPPHLHHLTVTERSPDRRRSDRRREDPT